MVKGILVLCGALALSAGMAAAQQGSDVKKSAIQPTPANNGQQMFQSYCSPCHGKDAKGNGPVAKALTKAPADLTRISARNNGTFPEVRVSRFISGEDEVPAHGTRDMPLWGTLFRSLGDGVGELRVANLKDYLKAIQQ
jgi:mono/diheme cytochrome c family protein